jgi:hypothetical protein
VEAG